MPARRMDFGAAVALYEAGLSIAEVAEKFSMTRQSMHKILSRRGVEMRHLQQWNAVEWKGRKFSLRENGYYAATSGDREYPHRAIWADAFGPIPNGYEVHHRDENKSHNSLQNFELLTSAEHGHRHGFRGNQHIRKPTNQVMA